MSDSPILTLRIRPDHFALLKAAAERSGLSHSDLVRVLICRAIGRPEEEARMPIGNPNLLAQRKPAAKKRSRRKR